MTTLQQMNFGSLLSTELAIPMGQSRMSLSISPTESLVLEFGRDQRDTVIRISKQFNTLDLTSTIPLEAPMCSDEHDEHEELVEYPLPTHHHNLPATVPPPAVYIKQEPELDELESQHQNVVSLQRNNNRGRRHKYTLRNQDDTVKVNLEEYTKIVKRQACLIVAQALASVDNYPSTIEEMLDTHAGSPVACAFRGRIRDLNKHTSKSLNATIHENGNSDCKHKGHHLICENGKGTNTRFWIDQPIADKLFVV